MKKLFLLLGVTMLLILPILTGCSSEDEVVEIREQFFVQQIEYMLRNTERFVGTTVRMEGMFMGWTDGSFGGNMYYFVVRNVSDCCGGGGSAGFEVYMGDFAPPENNAWVEITGIFELRNSWQPNNPMLVLTAIEELTVRGMETVMR